LFYSSSKLLIVDGNLKYCFYPNNLEFKKHLYFFKKVSKYITDNNITYNFLLKPRYVNFNITVKKSVYYKKQIFEIDLKAAYWYLAKKNNFIDNDLFLEGLRVPKKVRLISLGALAKRTYIFDYQKGICTDKPIELRSEATEGIFFKLAYDVDMIMRQCINLLNKTDFIFYWVDAVFFRGEHNIKPIVKLIESHGLLHKVVPIKNLIRKDKCFEVEDFDFKKRNFQFLKRVDPIEA
jgi:hypothetical protein